MRNSHNAKINAEHKMNTEIRQKKNIALFEKQKKHDEITAACIQKFAQKIAQQ